MSAVTVVKAAPSRSFPRLALLALAAGAFVMCTAEFVIAGLLPDIASDLGVGISTAGLLISGYALAIVIGGPLFVVAGTRVPRRRLLVVAAAVFVAGNLLSAVAGSYGPLMAGRVFGALGQGAFLATASVVAADLVAPALRTRAIALVFAGGTAANVAGSPLGALVGQQLGWRATFWAVAALGVVALAAVVAAVPTPPPSSPAPRGSGFGAFRSRQVWLTLAIGVAGPGGLFAAYTYIAPLLTTASGFSPRAIAPVLALFGIGLLVGNSIGGRFGGAQLRLLGIALGVLAAGLLGLAAGARSPVVATGLLVVVGAGAFAMVAPFMTRLIGQAEGAPLLAAAVGGSATNSGAALGAYLGGVAIDTPLGVTGPPVAGAAMAAAGLLAVALAARYSRRP
ncbi:MFS transporter [Pseudonocardia acaciae]|uniref:MFS transporter n=1 Tax=Pseudonocardia acaciae TaxID=551276 RepID=UPI0006842153|nr:MFS transporter [Pseudonocardia acaciae]